MWYALSCKTKKPTTKTKGRYMQEYTLFQESAATQTVDLPAFGGKLDVSWNPGSSHNFHSYLPEAMSRDRTARRQRAETPSAPDVHASQGEGDTVVAHAHRRVHEANFRNCGAVGL